MESEHNREAYERVLQKWEETWDVEWNEKPSNRMEWRTLFSMIFDEERADLYSTIFEERGLELREVLERGKVHQDIRSRGETYLRSLDIQWANEDDIMKLDGVGPVDNRPSTD